MCLSEWAFLETLKCQDDWSPSNSKEVDLIVYDIISNAQSF